MKVPIKPLADRLVAVRDEAKKQTASGLYLPEAAKEKPVSAKVVAIGSKVKDVKVGDTIFYKDYMPTELKIDATTYLIMKEEDVLATA